MWERTLQDLIRGLRANKKDEAKFIALAVDEIRKEVRSKDMELKAAAILKLTYLDMMGYDMTWASFNVVEVMSSPRVHLKSIGYLGATQSFTPDTDVLMLITNLLKKDLTTAIPGEVAIALNGISHLTTPELSRDLSRDLIAQLNHSRAYIRKRAVVATYKVFTQYPQATEAGMPRLREKLDDPDPGVVAATVNVLCELARRNPQDYLPLAPALFHLLTTSSNNWMLIKIIKLFGSLCPYEPRLVKKLIAPISELIVTTSAISLLYECVHTCIIGGMLQGSTGDRLAATCVTKLAAFLQDTDHNLKYIALLALVKIVPSHPHLVAEHQDMILASINDDDMSIRLRALDLISAMVEQNNLQSIVQQMLSHLANRDSASSTSAADALRQTTVGAVNTASTARLSPAYRLLLSQRILAVCSQNTYENVTNFEWLLSVVVDLVYVAKAKIGPQLRDLFIDVVGRVRGARRYAVQLAVKLLCDSSLLSSLDDEDSCGEILWAAAWVTGEYCNELAEPRKLLPYLLPETSQLPSETLAVYVHAATKVCAFWMADLAERWEDDQLSQVIEAVNATLEALQPLLSSEASEVQERAANCFQLFTFVKADLSNHRPIARAPTFEGPPTGFESAAESEPVFPKSLFLLQPLFNSYDLNPVAPAAQASVPVPEGLDLDAWIVPALQYEDIHENDDGAADEERSASKRKGKEKDTGGKPSKSKDGKKKKKRENGDEALESVHETLEEAAEREKRRLKRAEEQKDNPYYINDRASPRAIPSGSDVDAIPIVRLEGLPSPASRYATLSDMPLLRESSAKSSPAPFLVDRTGEMPANAVPPALSSGLATPTNGGSHGARRSGTPSTPVGISDYDPEDGARTPDPIKVTPVKKKGTSGKSKRSKTKASAERPEPDY